MSEHDIAAKCARQVADLQAALTELRVLYADRERDLTHEYQRAEAAEAAAHAQSEDVQRNWLSPIEAAGLKAQNAKLRGAVLAITEWEDGDGYCLWCKSLERHGHASDCQRQLALGIAMEAPA